MSDWKKAREAVDNLAANLGDSPIDPETDCDLGPILEAIRRGEQAQGQGDLLRHAAEQEAARLRAALAASDAREAALRGALEQADAWIVRNAKIDGHRDGACRECFPTADIPPAFAGFRCAWHWAEARAAVAKATGGGP